MSKMMIGSMMGFMMGVGLMMTATGKAMKKDVENGVQKAKSMMKMDN